MPHLKAIKQPSGNKAPKVKKIFIAGVGAVGATLLKQLSSQNPNHSIRVLGVCNSKHVLWYDGAQSNYSLRDLLRAPAINWDTIFEKLTSYDKGSVVFVDATGTSAITGMYSRFLKNNIHVVTPSKLANTQSQNQFDTLQSLSHNNGTKFLYETNVGAGLPIIQTIKNLISTGDRVIELSGVLSGTMTYIFSELEKGCSFSETVLKARQLGYAEPDPRDDLSGEDVARKFMILARICGLRLEREEVTVESLIPKNLQHVDSSAFLENLHTVDNEWKDRLQKATQQRKTLRYTGKLSDGKITIGIEAVDQSSTVGRLTGTNNLIRIQTERYNDQPLIIQGPGAGKEVTAAGVLADILSIT